MSSEGIVTGNAYDKRSTRNPVARALVARFDRAVDALVLGAAPASLLDVGCGEGDRTHAWARRLPHARVTGVDLDDARLRAAWRAHAAPNLEFRVARAEALPFGDGELDACAAIEVLEHVEDPARALAELVRVARLHVLVSVPREPLWRALNVARGAYLRQLGDTPGHRRHWSRREILRLLGAYGEVVAVGSPLPWTVVLLRSRAPAPPAR